MIFFDSDLFYVQETPVVNFEFFGGVKALAGVLSCYEKDGFITLEGVPGFWFQQDIDTNWKTTKISNNLFNKITRFTVKFKSFFALDVLYMLENLLDSPKRLGIGKNTAKKIMDALLENTWLKRLNENYPPRLNFSRLNLFYKSPLPHQQEFFEKYNTWIDKYNLKGYLLDAAAGSGKTMVGCFLAEMLEVNHCIVICPKNAVQRVWEKTLLEEFKIRPTFWTALDKEADSYKKEKYIVSHYESLDKVIEIARGLSGKIMIILDESHNLNEITSQRTQKFIELCQMTKSKDIIWASGTPIKALGSECIPLLRTIDPLFDEEATDIFKKIFGKDAKKALDILSNRIKLISHKVEKKELKLSEPIIENFKVKTINGELYTLEKIKDDMAKFIQERVEHYRSRKDEDHAFYNQCLDYFENNHVITKEDQNSFDKYKQFVKVIQKTSKADFHLIKDESVFCNTYENRTITPKLPDDWKKKFKDVKSVVKYVELKIQGECLGRILGKKRMECVKELSSGIDFSKYIESTVKKTIIFTSYVEVLEAVEKQVIEKGYNPISVYGKTNADLNKLVTRFDQEKEINPLIATFPSLSTAVPLVMADVMVMTNSPFRDYILQQAISRIHRIGATTQVYVYIAYLDTADKPNLSTRTIDILKWSQSQIEAITGVKSPFEVEDIGVNLEDHEGNIFKVELGLSIKELGIEEYFDFSEVIKEKISFSNW